MSRILKVKYWLLQTKPQFLVMANVRTEFFEAAVGNQIFGVRPLSKKQYLSLNKAENLKNTDSQIVFRKFHEDLIHIDFQILLPDGSLLEKSTNTMNSVVEHLK